MFKGLVISIPVATSTIVLLAHLCLPRFLLPDQISATFFFVGAGIISSYILLGMPLHWLLSRIGWRRLYHHAASGAVVAAACGAGLEMFLGSEGAAPNWLGAMALVGVYSLIGAFCAATFWLIVVRSDRSAEKTSAVQ
jgi:uncharacterized membrane protein YbhN (UPF0104 family)